MTEQTPNPNPADVPVDPLSTHPASPFLRTEAPTPVAFGSPPNQTLTAPIYSTWVTYRTQIQFGLTLLAYLMVLVDSFYCPQPTSQTLTARPLTGQCRLIHPPP